MTAVLQTALLGDKKAGDLPAARLKAEKADYAFAGAL